MRMELDVHRPLLLAPGAGETVVDRPEKTLRILAELDDVIITWFRYAPGEKGPDAHVHHHHTDAFYVLEGEIEVSLGPLAAFYVPDGAVGFRVGDESPIARPGNFLAAPRNSVHGFRPAGADPIRCFNVHAPPAGFLDRLRARD